MGPVRPPRRERPQHPADNLASTVLGPVETALFESLYVAYHRDALRLAAALLADQQQAADAVQSAYLEILRKLVAGRRWYSPEAAKAVVLRNTRWAALNLARTRQALLRLERRAIRHDVGVDSDDWAAAEARALCEQIVGELRPMDREAIELRFLHGLSQNEAAARLGISAKAFESRLGRALSAARRAARGFGAVSVRSILFDLWRGHPRRILEREARRACRIGASAAVGAAILTGGTAAAADIAGLSAMGPDHVVGSAHARPATALDGIRSSTLVDMILVPTQTQRGVVLALGRGARCSCWIVFHSGDAGRTWDAAPGPATAPVHPRLQVSRHYPTDPRIFLVPGTARGAAMLQAPTFGAAFAEAANAVLILPAKHAADASGQLMVGAGRFLYVDPRGTLYCSIDGGTSWGRSCDR